MSGNNLTVDGEFRYIIQWFNEWSELQREDFFPIFVDYLSTQDGASTIYMNGVVSSMANSTCNDKPMSLFQCRIKLFKEWSKKWPKEFKDKLKEKVIEIDPKYGEKLNEDLESLNMNGRTSPIAPAAGAAAPAPAEEAVAVAEFIEVLPPQEESNGVISVNEEIIQSA